MSIIGKIKTSVCIEHDLLVGTLGGTNFAPFFDAPLEVEVDVTAVLYCDSTEEGPGVAELSASYMGNELSEDAVELLGLEVCVLEEFADSGLVHPEVGSVWQDPNGTDWVVIGTGRFEGQALGDTVMLNSRSSAFATAKALAPDKPSSRMFRMRVGCARLVPLYELVATFYDDEADTIPWRQVLQKDEPAGGEWSNPSVVYAGKPK